MVAAYIRFSSRTSSQIRILEDLILKVENTGLIQSHFVDEGKGRKIMYFKDF